MLREDVEEIAEKKGCAEVTADLLTRIWEEAPRGVSWSPEAWERLQTAPEFVRSGIKKAAERRARKAGAVEITSGMLTRFRNEAMMKAVMRIRRLGFTELTFEAFDAAKEKVKRLQNNEEAEERLEHIRAYMTGGDRSSGDILGKDIMERFRRYLSLLGLVLAVAALVQMASGTRLIYGFFRPLYLKGEENSEP
ncbi:MAG: PCP reductase family protein [Nitrospirae bacterium]|nr:PCP reductase family protein [Nitrospirota bacterium]